MKANQRALLTIPLLLASGSEPIAARSDEPSLLTVSIPKLEIQPAERIVGFQINLTAAATLKCEITPRDDVIPLDPAIAVLAWQRWPIRRAGRHLSAPGRHPCCTAA